METASLRRAHRRRRTLEVRRPARFLSSITITTSTPNPTFSSKAASWRHSSRAARCLIPLRSMFEQMGATVSWDAGQQDRDGLETRRRGQGDRRKTGGRHQRRVASAGRSADDLSRRRTRARPRNFGRHGRVRPVGSGPAFRRRAVHPGDAAAEPGTAPAFRGSATAATATADAAVRFSAKRSWRATTSSRHRSTTSSIRAATPTAATADTPSAAEASSASGASRSCSRARTSAGRIRITARRSTASFQPNCYVTTIGGGGSSPVVTNNNLYDQNVDVSVRGSRPTAADLHRRRLPMGREQLRLPEHERRGLRRRKAAGSQPAALVLRQRVVLPERLRNGELPDRESVPEHRVHDRTA